MKRADLYALVWTNPVTHVAKQFGISDVAIRKICVKHGIPTPPLGYWAKLQHGKKVVQTALPPLKPGQRDWIELRERPEIDLPTAVIEAHQHALLEKARDDHRISVPTERPVKLHPLAAATERALRKAKTDEEGFVASHGAGTLNIYIGPASIDRVVILIHVMLNAVTERGHHLSADSEFRVVVDEQPLAIRIYESKDKKAHEPTAAELKKQAEENRWRSQYPSIYRSDSKIYRTWDYYPSGRLAIEISDPKQVRWQSDPIIGRWRDRPTKRLESYLDDVIAELKIGGAIARHQREKEAEAARLEREAEVRRREQEIQRRLLERVTAFFAKKADQHAQLIKLENLASHFAANSDQGLPDTHGELHRALEFVLANLRQQLSADTVNKEIVRTQLLEP